MKCVNFNFEFLFILGSLIDAGEMNKEILLHELASIPPEHGVGLFVK